MQKLEAATATLQGQLQDVSEVMTKGVLVWAKEHARQSQGIQDQETLIAAMTRKLNRVKVLADGSIPMYKRFFVHAKERIIDRAKTRYVRDDNTTAILNQGNEAVHRANFIAHFFLCFENHLSPEEIGVFEKIYGFHPKKFGTMLDTDKLREMYTMMGSMASFPARIKFGIHQARYEEFLALSKAVAKLRDLEKERGTEIAHRFDQSEGFLLKYQAMETIFDEFTNWNKAELEWRHNN
jgi:hypothetical protein